MRVVQSIMTGAPSVGTFRDMPTDKTVRVRLTETEQAAWIMAAKRAGYPSLSAWLRALASAAAGLPEPEKKRGPQPLRKRRM